VLRRGLPGARGARQAGAEVLVRRAAETVRALAVLGITAHLLDAAAVTELLADALSPGVDRLPGLAAPGEPITATPDLMEVS
jgi:hypothetical protein